MKDVFQILADNSVEITDEQKANIKKAIAENYKTINEFNKKADDLKAKEEELAGKDNAIDEMKKQIEGLEADTAGVADLKKQVEEYQQAEEERKANAEREKKIAGIKARFSPLKADKEFFNEYVENGVFDEFCKALADEANTGKSDKEIYEAITKDKDIYKNPNARVNIPDARGNGGDKEKEAIDRARAIMGLPKGE